MSSGFVSTSELDEEKKARQEAWEKIRKPTDATCKIFLFFVQATQLIFSGSRTGVLQ